MTEQGKLGWRGQGREEADQDRAGLLRVGQSRVGKGEGNAKDNARYSALQERAKGMTDRPYGGGQGRTDYK